MQRWLLMPFHYYVFQTSIMKKLIYLLSVAFLLTGCMKTSIDRSYTFFRPVYSTKAEVQAAIRSDAPVPIVSPGKLFYKDGHIFLNEFEKGIHIIDVQNVSSPSVRSFVNIPQCVDLAVRGNILYADLGTDLVAIDISNPQNVELKKVLSGVFPHRYSYVYSANSQEALYLVNFVRVDTTISGEADQRWGVSFEDMTRSNLNFAHFAASTGTKVITNGIGGSMARFGLAGDRMYTVDWSNLKIFNTAIPESPQYVSQQTITTGNNVETIFPFQDKLFIGSMQGMFIYDISNRDKPVQAGKFEHARVCDPVISDGVNAYVTLRSSNAWCGGFINQLDVLDVTDIYNPKHIKTYTMASPYGLSKDGDVLIICEGKSGLKFMDARDPAKIEQLALLGGMETFDVIALDGIAYVSAADGLYLVDYSNPRAPQVKSKITFKTP